MIGARAFTTKPTLPALAEKGIFVGTSSWNYPGGLGQVYTEERYKNSKGSEHPVDLSAQGRRIAGVGSPHCGHAQRPEAAADRWVARLVIGTEAVERP